MARVDIEELDALIAANFDENTQDTATSGECGTFALALYRVLKSQGHQPELVLVCEANDDGGAYEFQPGEIAWRHCAVKVAGQFFDVEGVQNIEDLEANYVWGNARSGTHVVLSEQAFLEQIKSEWNTMSQYFYDRWHPKLEEVLTSRQLMLL